MEKIEQTTLDAAALLISKCARFEGECKRCYKEDRMLYILCGHLVCQPNDLCDAIRFSYAQDGGVACANNLERRINEFLERKKK